MRMNLSDKARLWARFQRWHRQFPALKLSMDLSRVDFPDDLFSVNASLIQNAFDEMKALEEGAIANRDEQRQVGHYWLRNPDLARTEKGEPDPAKTDAIRTSLQRIKHFAAEVHSGQVTGAAGSFRHLLVIGIGGSALGPQFVTQALGHPRTDKLEAHFFDNTDPDGMDRVLARLEGQLGHTLCVVISKSGGTKETANGMKEAQAAYGAAGLKFAEHVVAITQQDSALDQLAVKEKWLRRFPMWSWVGGRTSETAAVGLLPAALQGYDIDQLLAGAAACDEVTRSTDADHNPSMLLALMWHHLGEGRGAKDMVVIPYKDRLELFSRYLQQLVMESLGKELERHGKVANQGIAVYGNKGSTDQHAYVQQLREGLANFFVTFIEVLKDRAGKSIEVDPGITSGDYLNGFLLGTREALFEKGRESLTLTLDEVSPFTVGVLIALFERAVGFYASLVNINAYHQPGVEAGKKAATSVLELQGKVVAYLAAQAGSPGGQGLRPEAIAAALGLPEEAETVFKICEHLGHNPGRGVRKIRGVGPQDSLYA